MPLREIAAICCRSRVDSFRRLQREADIVIVEGAGSPAETNLRAHDIANMGFAHAADVPVVLVGDIDRGHVIASLVGAHAVLDARDRARIRGFIVNKFRGDVQLFRAGIDTIEARTGWPSLGVVPWLHAAGALPAEDAMQLEHERPARANARVRIAIPHVPHIANFDDFDPLRFEPEVQLEFVAPGRPLPLDADLSSFPAARRRSPTSSSSARRAGTSTCKRTSAAAGACSASAPAIRCSARASKIRNGSKVSSASCPGLDLARRSLDHDRARRRCAPYPASSWQRARESPATKCISARRADLARPDR